MNSNLSKKIKVCHLTSAHPPKDGRIFQKECSSLAKAGYDVTLVVSGDFDEICNGVHIIGTSQIRKSRLQRILNTSKDVYKKACTIDADIYHIHDPELLPYALKLKRKGKKVIFDSHENVPSDIRNKKYLPKPLRSILGFCYEHYEAYVLKRLDAVISVTPHIVKRLQEVNPKTSLITNYPIVSLTDDAMGKMVDEENAAYVGPIRPLWNISRILDCIGELGGKVKLLLAGPMEHNILAEYEHSEGWKYTCYFGKVPPNEVAEIYSRSFVGFALLQPTANTDYKTGTLGNTKLFEIMYAGIPVICTDFILWKEIIDKYNCGICVDPNNKEEIMKAIMWLYNHPDDAKNMGDNGRKAVISSFNWQTQETKLLTIYHNL